MVEVGGSDQNRIVDSLVSVSQGHPFGTVAYFDRLTERIALPPEWKRELVGVWTNHAWGNASRLVRWAIARGVNPADPRFYTLGTVLNEMIQDQGLDGRYESVAVILRYDLCRDEETRSLLAQKYHWWLPTISSPAENAAEQAVDLGPDIDFLPELSELELHSLLSKEPDYLDVGFLIAGMKRASSVCRLESTSGQSLGTGFLIGGDKVLTAAHVVRAAPGSGSSERARHMLARFQCISGPSDLGTGRIWDISTDDPLPAIGNVDQLDFALLRLGHAPGESDGISSLSIDDPGRPSRGDPLHILAHPSGSTLQLSMSTSGVAAVLRDRHLLQYVTKAERGSSGAPCFDGDWRLVAIHHAERQRAFGSVREGILLEPVIEQIGKLI